MEIPNTVSLNTLVAYETDNIGDLPRNIKSDSKTQLLPLRELCLITIAANFETNPVYDAVGDVEDRNVLIDFIDVGLPIKLLSRYVKSDVFWQRCFRHRWPNYYPPQVDRPWIQLYLEKFLSETVEHLKPLSFDQMDLQSLLHLCDCHVEKLHVEQLQPSLTDSNYHIPFEGILSGLSKLKIIDLTFDSKSIWPYDFIFGCSNVVHKDIESLSLGIEKCYELVELRLHSTRIEPFMLEKIANALDHVNKLEVLEIDHCQIGNEGLKALSHGSLQHLRHLILINNFLSEFFLYHNQ